MATPTTTNGIDARVIGHGVAVLIGALAVVAGVAALAKGLPAAMGITLVIVGGLLLGMTPLSLRGSRSAWSLLIAILAVFTAVTLFGAPTIHKEVGIAIGIALILPLVQIIGVIALATTHERYRED
jgi:uncharacterized membrane protein HdeD (DUF308 family)